MEFEDQPEPEGDGGSGPSSDSIPTTNSSRPPSKLQSPVDEAAPIHLRNPRYKECLKNHAVGIGGHAVDGCGEFLPAGEDGTLYSLRCAACNCHRNFHRREKENHDAGAALFPLTLSSHHPLAHFGAYRGPTGYLHLASPQTQTAAPLALPSSSGGGGSEMEDYQSHPSISEGKKRFRTRFTLEQKGKMLGFAERLDWRIQRQDEELVQQFCGEMGVKARAQSMDAQQQAHARKENLG